MKFSSTIGMVAALLAMPQTGFAQRAGETDFVVALMQGMNQLSVRFNLEVCGYIIANPDGTFRSSKTVWGSPSGCTPIEIGEINGEVVSSWHTHAAHAPDYDSEVPSVDDVLIDLEEGVTGWVGTPSGRLWFIDAQTGELWQACEQGCLPADPIANDDHRAPVDTEMTFYDLYSRFEDSADTAGKD